MSQKCFLKFLRVEYMYSKGKNLKYRMKKLMAKKTHLEIKNKMHTE